jgi:hypothetical protein
MKKGASAFAKAMADRRLGAQGRFTVCGLRLKNKKEKDYDQGYGILSIWRWQV